MEVLLTFEALDEADYKNYMFVSRFHYDTWCLHQDRLFWNKHKHTLFRNWTLDRVKDGKLSTLGKALLCCEKYHWTTVGPHVYPFLECAKYKRGDVVAKNGDFFVSDSSALHFYSSTELVRKRSYMPEAQALLDEKYSLRTHPHIMSPQIFEFEIVSLRVGFSRIHFEADEYGNIVSFPEGCGTICNSFSEISDYVLSQDELDTSTLRVIRSCYGLTFSSVC